MVEPRGAIRWFAASVETTALRLFVEGRGSKDVSRLSVSCWSAIAVLKELTMQTHRRSSDPVATIGLDIGKNTFHLVGLDKRGAIAMRIKVSHNQLVRRLLNLPPCFLGLEAGSGSHHIARQIEPYILAPS
jgi:hypothetical protein